MKFGQKNVQKITVTKVISVVLDTNILASGILNTTTPPGQILNAWRDGQFELATSAHIIDELERTFQKPYFQKRLNNNAIASFIDLLQNETAITAIIIQIQGVATHPEDDLTLATAVNAKADYLVTGDGPLLRKVGRSYQGIKLVTPNDFIEILKHQGN